MPTDNAVVLSSQKQRLVYAKWLWKAAGAQGIWHRGQLPPATLLAPPMLCPFVRLLDGVWRRFVHDIWQPRPRRPGKRCGMQPASRRTSSSSCNYCMLSVHSQHLHSSGAMCLCWKKTISSCQHKKSCRRSDVCDSAQFRSYLHWRDYLQRDVRWDGLGLWVYLDLNRL